MGDEAVGGIIRTTGRLRDWPFCMAFVSTGLQARERDLVATVRGGKPVTLCLVGQTTNVILTLLAAWLFFGGGLLPPLPWPSWRVTGGWRWTPTCLPSALPGRSSLATSGHEGPTIDGARRPTRRNQWSLPRECWNGW